MREKSHISKTWSYSLSENPNILCVQHLVRKWEPGELQRIPRPLLVLKAKLEGCNPHYSKCSECQYQGHPPLEPHQADNGWFHRYKQVTASVCVHAGALPSCGLKMPSLQRGEEGGWVTLPEAEVISSRGQESEVGKPSRVVCNPAV